MYVELYGDRTHDENDFPAMVYLKLRHMGDSYFRDVNRRERIKEFRQPLASWRTFEFNRFSITNDQECNKDKRKGISK